MTEEMKRKMIVAGILRCDVWGVLQECVENGVAYGWARAHKHTAKPDEELIKDQIYDGVMNAIAARFDTVGNGDE